MAGLQKDCFECNKGRQFLPSPLRWLWMFLLAAGLQAQPLERNWVLEPGWPGGTGPLGENPEFGASIAADQSWLAIGAPGKRAVNNDLIEIELGRVALYMRMQGQWQAVTELLPPSGGSAPRCGTSVALRMPWLAVGCPGGRDPDGGSGAQGMIAIYRWLGHQSWALHSMISPNTTTHCGASVDISSPDPVTGSVLLAAGCPGWTVEVGQARVWRYDVQLNRWDLEATLVGSVAEPGRLFGSRVSLYRQRIGPVNVQRLAVAGPGMSNGTGMLAMFEGGSWTETLTWMGPAADSRFGSAVKLLGSQFFVGADGNAGGADCASAPFGHCGRVFRARREAGTWQPDSSGIAVNMGGNPPGPQVDGQFGAAIAVGMGQLVAIGAPGTNGYLATIPPQVAPAVGMVELRRAASGGFGIENADYLGELRPSVIFPGNALVGGRFGAALAFGPDFLAVGYPQSGSPAVGRRGSVWIYQWSDQLFADRFE